MKLEDEEMSKKLFFSFAQQSAKIDSASSVSRSVQEEKESDLKKALALKFKRNVTFGDNFFKSAAIEKEIEEEFKKEPIGHKETLVTS